MAIHWTERAQDDLAALHAFIEADSTHYATVTVRRLLSAVDRLQDFPKSIRICVLSVARSVAGPRTTAFRVELAKSREGWKPAVAGTQAF